MTYNNIINRLTAIYPQGEARAIARMLLEDGFGMSMTDIFAGGVENLGEEDEARLRQMVGRLEQAEPIQYVLGCADFCGLRFGVSPAVLIPRPETEELVELIVKDILTSSESCPQPRILDIGTGSGCIAIAIADGLKKHGIIADIEAWDISEEALAVARDNALRNNADVTFRQVDVLSITPEDVGDQYTVIVSNPPYICHSEAKDMERNVLEHEPHLALFVPDEDPLLFYRAIALLGKDLLNTNGRLYYEINREYRQETMEMMQSMGYTGISDFTDQFGNNRIIRGERP